MSEVGKTVIARNASPPAKEGDGEVWPAFIKTAVAIVILRARPPEAAEAIFLVFIQEKTMFMLPPELANPFSKPKELNPDTAGMVEDMLGKKAREAFEALDKEPKRPKEKPQELTEKEKAAIRQAQERLERSWKG